MLYDMNYPGCGVYVGGSMTITSPIFKTTRLSSASSMSALSSFHSHTSRATAFDHWALEAAKQSLLADQERGGHHLLHDIKVKNWRLKNSSPVCSAVNWSGLNIKKVTQNCPVTFYGSTLVIVKLPCKQTDVEMSFLTKKIVIKIVDATSTIEDEGISVAEDEELP